MLEQVYSLKDGLQNRVMTICRELHDAMMTQELHDAMMTQDLQGAREEVTLLVTESVEYLHAIARALLKW